MQTVIVICTGPSARAHQRDWWVWLVQVVAVTVIMYRLVTVTSVVTMVKAGDAQQHRPLILAGVQPIRVLTIAQLAEHLTVESPAEIRVSLVRFRVVRANCTYGRVKIFLWLCTQCILCFWTYFWMLWTLSRCYQLLLPLCNICALLLSVCTWTVLDRSLCVDRNSVSLSRRVWNKFRRSSHG